jgi:hypothetical protein
LQYYDGTDRVTIAKGPPPSPFSNTAAHLGNDIDGEANADHSGSSVSISADGNTLAIGADQNNGSFAEAGHVRIYHFNGNAWIQLGNDIDGEAFQDRSGSSVSLSDDGTTLAIGAKFNDGNGNNSGHVRVYNWNDTIWTQLGSDIDGEAADDQSGYSVSISADGTTLAIGAPINDGNGNNSGHVRVYNWNDTIWTQLGSDIDGEAAGDFSGWSVSLSADGSILAIGAPNNSANGTESGHVRVYHWISNTWIQQGNDLDGESLGDESGSSVSISSDGNTLAIGAQENCGSGILSGHARVVYWDGTAWLQKGKDIDAETAGDLNGWSVSLSANGSTIAISAFLNSSTGLYAGHVRVFHWNGTHWLQQGTDIDGEAVGDQSGYSVSLSADGTTLAIGAILNDGSEGNAGHVRVYK